MIKLYDFPGGVHPVENKQQSQPGKLLELPLPEQLVLPVGQHIGAPAKPVVKVGDQVFKGQLLAEATGPISAALHAPTSGTVSAIDEQTIAHPSALQALCITLTCDGQDQWQQPPSYTDPSSLSEAEVWQRVQQAGLAGMGGAGFPTAAKLATDKPIDTLIINGVECEPYITADDTLMQLEADAIASGIAILQSLLNQPRCLMVIEDNKPAAIKAMEAATGDIANVEVVVIPTKYPSGGEKQLIENVTGKQVPKGGLPADIGIVCQNVATAKALYDAVAYQQPLLERIVTITGEAAGTAGNYRVLLGTPIAHLLQHTQSSSAKRWIMGGPMMGFELADADIGITKTSNCILLPSAKELATEQQAMACIRCGQCEQACPANLLPQQLYWFAKGDAFDKLEQYNLMDCIECGACAYVCPSQIPLVQHYRYAKGMMRQQTAEAKQAEYAKQRFEAREQRLADEQAAKEARRKERAAAAAAAQAAKRKAAEEAGEEDPVAAAQARLKAKQATANKPAKEAKTDAPPSHKDLKTAAAVARTKLKKASKALADAQAAGHEGAHKLAATVTELEQKSTAAAKALADFEATSGVDPEAQKQAQVAWAKANAAVRKLQKNPPAEGEDDSDYKQQLATAEAVLTAAKQHLDSLT